MLSSIFIPFLLTIFRVAQSVFRLPGRLRIREDISYTGSCIIPRDIVFVGFSAVTFILSDRSSTILGLELLVFLEVIMIMGP